MAVVDARGRCVGVVRLSDLVRALAESRVEEAAGLNPLTRLPGSQAITDEVDRRIAAGRAFALSWLDVDHFKQVNDGAGFAAGDELIRSVGQALLRTAGGETRVGHIGGDDFLMLSDPDGLDRLAAAVLDVAWSAGGRPVTLSLATVLCGPGSVPDHRRAAARLAPLKKAAKALGGASWVLGRADVPGHEVMRGPDDGAGRLSGRAGGRRRFRAEPGGSGRGTLRGFRQTYGGRAGDDVRRPGGEPSGRPRRRGPQVGTARRRALKSGQPGGEALRSGQPGAGPLRSGRPGGGAFKSGQPSGGAFKSGQPGGGALRSGRPGGGPPPGSWRAGRRR